MALFPASSMGGVKSDTFSNLSTDSTGNVTLYNGTNRVIVGASDTNGNCYAIWRDSSRSYGKVYTTLNDVLTVRKNITVSGTYYYLDN